MALLTVAAVLQQAPAVQVQLERIAWSQIVMAVALGLVTLAMLAVAVGAFLLFRSVRKAVGSLQHQVQTLLPKAEPLLTAAGKVASDATSVSATAKERAEEILTTVKDLNERLRELATETEGRVRDFGAVLDVVQAETREILLDAAATARGVHTTAETLAASNPRKLAGRRGRRPK